jgi:hypothetical protein
LRVRVEHGYRHLKTELGWADFQVRTDRAIRCHCYVVCCIFTFYWRAWFAAAASGTQRLPTLPTKEAREPGIASGHGERRGACPEPGPVDL